MDISRRNALATGLLALVLTAGCTDGADPAGPQTSGGDSAAATGAADPVTFSALGGQATRLSLDDGVTSALGAVGVELVPTGAAEVESSGGTTTFVFPVTGGEATVDPDGSPRFTGTVEHDGGLQLSALGRTATVDQLVLDGEQLTAEVAGRRVPLLPLVTDPEVTVDGEEQAMVSWSPGSIDTGADGSIADQLGVPSLPDLEVNSLETTLEGS